MTGLRFGVRPGSPGEAAKPTAWLERLLDHFTAMARAADGRARLLANTDSVVRTIRQAADQGCWSQAIELTRVVEPLLAEAARWGAWKSVLDAALDAARASGDRSAEGWMLHQLGMREMALGEPARAFLLLSDALAVRAETGEDEQAGVTRSQLAGLVR